MKRTLIASLKLLLNSHSSITILMTQSNPFTALDPIDELTPYLYCDEDVDINEDLFGDDYADAILADLNY